MYQILDTLVPWWHLAKVTSKGESHLLVVYSGSWNNFGRVHTYPLQQKASCVTILLYGCESWVISKDMENKINAFATSCYRVMLNIKRIDHVLNTTIYSMTRYALYIPTIGKRRPGRPPTSYLNYVQRLLGDNEGAMQEQQFAAFADDRHAWRNLVVACSAVDG